MLATKYYLYGSTLSMLEMKLQSPRAARVDGWDVCFHVGVSSYCGTFS